MLGNFSGLVRKCVGGSLWGTYLKLPSPRLGHMSVISSKTNQMLWNFLSKELLKSEYILWLCNRDY